MLFGTFEMEIFLLLLLMMIKESSYDNEAGIDMNKWMGKS